PPIRSEHSAHRRSFRSRTRSPSGPSSESACCTARTRSSTVSILAPLRSFGDWCPGTQRPDRPSAGRPSGEYRQGAEILWLSPKFAQLHRRHLYPGILIALSFCRGYDAVLTFSSSSQAPFPFSWSSSQGEGVSDGPSPFSAVSVHADRAAGGHRDH